MSTIDLTERIGSSEKILWKGKPIKKAFFLRSLVNPMLPIALVWVCFDSFIISTILGEESGMPKSIAAFLIPFFLLHLMPVWLYLGGVLFSFLRYRNTAYLITDRAVYFSGGTFSTNIDMKPLGMLTNVSIHKGIIEKKLHCGSIYFSGIELQPGARRAGLTAGGALTLLYIEDCDDVFRLIGEKQDELMRMGGDHAQKM